MKLWLGIFFIICGGVLAAAAVADILLSRGTVT